MAIGRHPASARRRFGVYPAVAVTSRVCEDDEMEWIAAYIHKLNYNNGIGPSATLVDIRPMPSASLRHRNLPLLRRSSRHTKATPTPWVMSQWARLTHMPSSTRQTSRTSGVGSRLPRTSSFPCGSPTKALAARRSARTVSTPSFYLPTISPPLLRSGKCRTLLFHYHLSVRSLQCPFYACCCHE